MLVKDDLFYILIIGKNISFRRGNKSAEQNANTNSFELATRRVSQGAERPSRHGLERDPIIQVQHRAGE